MIGIEVTQQIKDQNELSNAVGSILTRGEYPAKWWGVERVVGGYQFRTDLHEADGWRDVVQPTIGENQKRGSIYFDTDNDVFTYEVNDLTEQEIAQRSEISMPRRDFKISLLEKHGVTNGHVDELFYSLVEGDSSLFVTVEKMKILWYESETFTNTTPELFQFAGMMNSIAGIELSEENLKQIFIDYQNGEV